MKFIGFTAFALFLLISSFTINSFKKEQLRYSRVRQAYKDSEPAMLALLNDKQLKADQLRIYLRAFKTEKKIELWGRNLSDSTYQLIKTYKVCRTSGVVGPKREQGDFQIPEGYYHIDRFNPYSNFHLSLGINYPNKSDKILGTPGRLGGDIFIHGDCVTIGCLPITDAEIKELYIFCVEVRNNGQDKIPVTIFPCMLTNEKFEELLGKHPEEEGKLDLWTDLKKGYDIFDETRQLPSVAFLSSGRHEVF